MVSMFEQPVTPGEAAEAAIRAYCGWHVAPVKRETLTVDGNGRTTLVLPTMRIQSVESVKIDGSNVTDSVRWSTSGMLEGVCFPRRFRAVEVTLEHGFSADEIGDIAGLIGTLTKRFTTDPRIRSQSVAGASVSYFGSNGGLSHLLTVDEMAALAPYRLTWGC